MNDVHENQREKLNTLLANVQKETSSAEFIYGVTDRTSRNLWQRAQDFFIDHQPIALKEKVYFFELLATMIHAGLPLNRALKILAAKTENKRLRRIIATVSYELEHGYFLSQALEHFPDVFEDAVIGMIRSAEAVGGLQHILSRLAMNLQRRETFAMRLRSALMYPSAVMIALMLGGILVVVFVVPRIEGIFSQSRVPLPFATKILLQTSLLVTKFWWLLLIGLIFTIIAFHMWTHSEEGRFSWDFRKLRIPLLGVLIRKIFVSRFVDMLGLLLESGLPLNHALELTAGAIGNEVYRVKIYEALGSVHEGKKLSFSLGEAPFLFPETITNMLAVGEQTASLGNICQKISRHYTQEITHTLKNLTTVLGPLLVVVIGGAVAFFALAVLSPIFSLTQAV